MNGGRKPSMTRRGGQRLIDDEIRKPLLASIGTALGAHRYRQQDLIEGFRGLWRGREREFARVERFHRAVRVDARHLALPMEAYPLPSFDEAARVFLDVGTDLAEQATVEALAEAGLEPADVDALFFTTVTGVAAPTLDVRLANRVHFRPDVKRLPFFGLGCVGGASGLARVYDYLLAWPHHVGVLLSVELCSLTFQEADRSAANLIASGLFADGAAAVVCVGAERARRMGLARPRILATRSILYPDTEGAMGWDVGSSGFSVVLSPAVPALVRENVARDVDEFLAEQGLGRADVGAWICHPGGPKILSVLADCLDLARGELDLTWRCLRDVGNVSSASALFVLRATIAEGNWSPGSPGLLLAMGPGFSSELVLLRNARRE
jgi:alkylresorcinol/alkylpyrone synthase